MINIFKKIVKPIYYQYKKINSKFERVRLISNGNPIYIEVGAGNVAGKNGWTTLDMTQKCDIYWDLRNGIPFPNESVEKIYSSHFMEHLTYQEGQNFLRESLRVLKPGGVFSVCVPNAMLFIEAYINRTEETRKKLLWTPACNNTTIIDYVNYIAYMGDEHKYMFDLENLVHILKKAGFKTAEPREYDPNLDLEERASVSIYALAVK